MLAVVIGIGVFVAFYRRADRSGRNGFRWGLVGSLVFLIVSSIVSAVLLQTTRLGEPGAEGIAPPVLALLGIGTGAGLAASAILCSQALPAGKSARKVRGNGKAT